MTPQRTRHPNKSYKTNRGTQYTSTPPHQRTQHTLPAIHITGQTIFSTNFAILHSDEPHLHQLNSEEHPTWNQDRFVYTNTENTVETPDSACITKFPGRKLILREIQRFYHLHAQTTSGEGNHIVAP